MSLPTPLASPNHSSVNLKLPPVPHFTKLPKQQQHVKIQVLLGMMKDVDGRDKLMKTLQYIIKILIYYKISTRKKWTQFAAQLSMTRQVMNLGNALHYLRRLRQATKNTFDFLSLSNTIVNAISDDVYCLCRIGVLPKSLEYKAERISAYCWFFGILEDLKSNFENMCQLEAEYKLTGENSEKLHISQISVLKLMADGVFCGCDVFNPSFSGVLQVWTGLFGALLGGYKVYNKLQ